jgi:hypothetical protein
VEYFVKVPFLPIFHCSTIPSFLAGNVESDPSIELAVTAFQI